MLLLRRGAQSVVAAVALTVSGVASAHHSQVMFDSSKCLTINGTVRNWEFSFPHSWLWIIVPNGDNAEDIWGFESASPAQMMEVDPRWTRDVVRKGDKITLRYSPLKDGRHGGQLFSMSLADGQTIRAATPACNNEAPPTPAAAKTQP